MSGLPTHGHTCIRNAESLLKGLSGIHGMKGPLVISILVVCDMYIHIPWYSIAVYC